MMNKEDEVKPIEPEIEKTVKPDVSAGLFLQAHLKISDPESGEVLLKIKG